MSIDYGERMKVYLDDERIAPEGWKRVYWPEEAIKLLQSGEVEEISLDHDLGDDTHGTGYDVVVWIEEQVIVNRFQPPKIRIHSANSSARIKMELGVKNIYANTIRNLRIT
ncbi:cyclic-phosphate processing receiver domain-containing protein [Vibrio sp. 10N.286.52.C3]|uniref:cyclic-phosphate processing receiver domain-containing protein n=1 Tax=unclassified Vibrio TaxID=2614977 RepID=UPI0035514982